MPLRPGHRADGLGAAARLRRELLRRIRRGGGQEGDQGRHGHRIYQPRPRGLPKLSPTFESTVPGIYVIGALAGYPLIKHCMNQGYDVVEFINGNTALKPADEPILEAKFAALPGRPNVDEWLEFLRSGSRSSTSCRRCRCASSCSIPRCGVLPRGRGGLRAQRDRLVAVRDRRGLGVGRGRSPPIRASPCRSSKARSSARSG